MQTLIINIKELLQVRETSIEKVSGKDMAVLPSIKNAYLLIKDDAIAAFGSMEKCPKINADKKIDASGKIVLPTWCDSHTHIVYAGNREQEFVDRINGLTYEQIANRGRIPRRLRRLANKCVRPRLPKPGLLFCATVSGWRDGRWGANPWRTRSRQSASHQIVPDMASSPHLGF